MKKANLACGIVALAVLFTSAGGALAQAVYDVRSSFGAHCDGTTDDTAALQNALDTVAWQNSQRTPLGTDIVLIPGPVGVTCVTTLLEVPANTQLNIQGTLSGRKRAFDAAAVLRVQSANVHIWGTGTVDAAKAVEAGSGIFAHGASDLHIDGGLTITNSVAWPINIQASTRVYLSHLTLTNGGAPTQCSGDISIRVPTTGCYADNLTVQNNGDSCFAFYGGVQDGWIIDSDLSGCIHGISVVSDSTQSLPNDNILIRHNNVHNNEGYGIEVLAFLVNAPQTRVTIDNNTIWGNHGGGIALAQGAQNPTVSNNTIHDDRNDPCAQFTSGFVGGIVVFGPAMITNNNISNEGVAHPGIGILFNIGLPDTVALSGNIISNLTYAYVGSIGPNVNIDQTNTVRNVAFPAPKHASLGFFNGSWVGYSFGLPGDIPFTGDINLDNTGDHVPVSMVFRPSEANWYVDKVSGGSWTPGNTRIVQFGLPGDYPELVYFGGIAHIAVYRPSTGQTLVNTDNQSYHGNNVLDVTGDPILGAAPSRPPMMPTAKQDGEWPGFTFGLAGDIPFEMRLTAGGPLSPVVYRPWEGNWYVATGRSGSPANVDHTVQFGFPIDDLPRVVSYGGVDHIAVYRCSTGQLLVNKDNQTYHVENGVDNVLLWPSP